MNFIACVFVHNEAVMKSIAAEMIEYAKTHPFDYQKAIDEAKQQGGERKGSFLVAKGNKEEDLGVVRPYTKFVSFDGKTSIQISYVEFTRGVEDFSQINIVNNSGEELTEEIVKYIWHMFFGDEPIHAAQTPPHVFLGAVIKYNYDPWAEGETKCLE